MSSNLITIAIGVVIVALLAIGFYVAIRKSKGGKEAAQNFLDGLTEHISAAILRVIKESTPEKYTSLEEFETDVLNAIYDDVWDYVETEAETQFNDNALIKAAFDLITKDRVIKFIDDLIEKDSIMTIIDGTYVECQMNSNGSEDQDKKLADEFADQSKYVEESDNKELAPAEEVKPTEDEAAALNPQTDEEESYDVEDDSMELVETETTIVTKQDKNGNTLYYEVTPDGKKTRISKAVALASGKISE